jgi:hypothetical protein
MNGRSMVDWLTSHSHLRARADALRICSQMISLGLLLAVEGGVFEDSSDSLYQFRPSQKEYED